MIKTRIIKVKSIENEDILMTIAMKKIIIATVLMKIIVIMIMRMRVKIGSCIKYKNIKVE